MCKTLGVIGCGNMGGAMVARWIATGALTPTAVEIAEADGARAAQARARLGVQAGTDAAGLLHRHDLILLAVKPQQARRLLPRWMHAARRGQTIMSILAGVSATEVAALLGKTPDVVRLMPKTPARVGRGCTAVVWPPGLPDGTRTRIDTLLTALGEVVALRESQIDGFTAICGSGPAYVFRFLESLALAAQRLGFDAAQARAMALATVGGACALAADDGRDPAALRVEVTSPGGTTAAALDVLERGGIEALITAATTAAANRAGELARPLIEEPPA